MKIVTILLLLFSFIFSGCGAKTSVVFKEKLVCYEMTKLEESEKVLIRVHKDDIALFEARSDELKENIAFYEAQIDIYNLACKEVVNNGKF